MSSGVLLTAVVIGAPLLAALLLLVRPLVPAGRALAPLAAAPAVLVGAGALAAAPLGAGSLLLGMRLFAADGLTRWFLLPTAIVWLAAGVFGRAGPGTERRDRGFWLFFSLTMAGNLGLVLAQDVVSFYAAYSLMGLAAYGLVVQRRGGTSRRAGRIYLLLALAGEMCLLVGLLLVVGGEINLPVADAPLAAAATPYRGAAALLLLAGFGIKIGIAPLHVWMPLAYPAAPPAGSAVLAGAMINAGALGLLRFLPLGLFAMPGWGPALVLLGLSSAVLGALVGVTQREPRAVLAYSSVSQMGFLTAALGVTLWAPEVGGTGREAIAGFAVHHAVAKAALFLGVAVAAHAGGRARLLVVAGLVWSALEISGAPLTSGALAKLGLKEVAHAAPAGAAALGAALSIAAIGSALLMLRFLALAWPRARPAGAGPPVGLWLPWAALLLLDAALPLAAPAGPRLGALLAPAALWSASWPVLAAVAIAAAALRARARMGRAPPHVPPGDLALLCQAAGVGCMGPLRRATARWRLLATRARRGGADRLLGWRGAAGGAADRAEEALGRVAITGALLLAVLALLLGALLVSALQ